MSRHAAIDYFRVPPAAPWRWEDDGRVLAWEDGTTLAFREELAAILERVAPEGLPRFAAVVLVLALCRGKQPALDTPATQRSAPALIGVLQARGLQQLDVELRRIAALPAAILGSTEGKALLLRLVLETQRHCRPPESVAIVEHLAEALAAPELQASPDFARPVDLAGMALGVVQGLRAHTGDSLLRQLRTGLDQLPGAADEIALPPEERVQRLLKALGENPQLGGLARVVRDLMAALRLPRSLTQADEIALGGASDIGNRGPLDRLLLSELAHDDLTLASRVALNEALYLRREPPAHRPRRTLALLLDSGVRMWGVPRVLGAAAALALLARQAGDCASLVWRAAGRDLVAVDLLTAKGLEAHLATLETELHPGAAVPALAELLSDAGALDLVIVTHRDALDDGDFQAQLAQLKPERGFLLLVERDGDVQLHALPWGSPRPLAAARIDVAKLFPAAPPGRTTPLTQPSLEDWPAIFRERPFPLLLPVNARMEYATAFEAGSACVTQDRRLLAWERTTLGARLLETDLPGGKTIWLHRDAQQRTIVVRGRGKDGRVGVVIVPAGGAEVKRVAFSGPPNPVAAWVDGEMLLIDLGRRVVVVSLERAEVVTETPVPPHVVPIQGCYYSRGDESLAFATWQGDRVSWENLVIGRNLRRRDVLTLFDRSGIGAWAVTRDGRVIGPTGEEWMKTGFSFAVARVKDAGARVFLQRMDAAWFCLDMASRQLSPWSNSSTALGNVSVVPPTRGLQTRFIAIAAAPGEPVRLHNAKGRWLEFTVLNQRVLQLTQSADPPAGVLRLRFAPCPSPAQLGCALRVVRWPNGSQAWLDSRGLLHLRSADATVPELTIALAFQSPLAAWCSNGVRLGPAFFHGADQPIEPGVVPDTLQKFCSALC